MLDRGVEVGHFAEFEVKLTAVFDGNVDRVDEGFERGFDVGMGNDEDF